MTRVPPLTWWSLGALAAGILLGLIGHLTGLAVFASVADVAQAAGALWVSALQMVAFPLVIALTLSAIASARAEAVGALGVRAILLYTVALVALAALTLSVASLVLARFSVDPATVTAINAAGNVSEGIRSAAASAPQGSWIDRVIPRNIFGSASRGEMFPLLVFTMLFAVTVTRLPPAQRVPLTGGLQAISSAMMVMVKWLLAVTPIGVFALSYGFSLKTGGSLAGLVGLYLLVQPAITLFCVALVYVVTAVLGRVPLTAFARAVAPAQIVAISTRSSLAALPALISGSRAQLPLQPVAADFLFPLSVSIFRISEVITNPVKLIFLAHVYGTTLEPLAESDRPLALRRGEPTGRQVRYRGREGPARRAGAEWPGQRASG